jgi:hypothetical protein
MTIQSTTQSIKSNLLCRMLQANGIFSGLSGVTMSVASGPLATFLGLDAPLILVAVGVSLILYALALFQASRQEPINRPFVIAAIVLDTLWVVASWDMLLTGLVSFTPAGWWTVAMVADIVTVFAVAQFVGLRRIS